MREKDLLRWAWGHRNARLLWIGRLCGFVADQLAEIALVWAAWALTGSASRVALALFLARAPYWAVLWFAGVQADRWPRQAIVGWSNLAAASVAGAICMLHAAGLLTFAVLATLAFALSAARAAELPALGAQLPELVDRGRIAAANILLDNTKRVARLVAPLLASALLAATAAAHLYAFAALGLVILAACAWRMVPRAPRARPAAPRPGPLRSLQVAWQVLRRDRPVFLVVTCFALYHPAYALCYWILLPRLVGTELAPADAASWHGVALAFFGAGALAGNLVVSLRGMRDPVAAAVAGIAIVAGGFAAMALATSLPAALLLAALAASGVPLMDIAQAALINARIPARHQGKVFALARYLAEVGVGAGLAAGGSVAASMGSHLGLALCGLYAVPLVLLLAVRLRAGVRWREGERGLPGR